MNNDEKIIQCLDRITGHLAMMVEMEKARGLTQRDKFAMATLSAIVRECNLFVFAPDENGAWVAKKAYELADSMMKARLVMPKEELK